MNRFTYCSCILLLSIQTPAMALGFKDFVAFLYILGNELNQTSFGETTIIRAHNNEGFLYFPKESVLQQCLDQSTELQSRDYHPAIIAEIAHFLALQKASPAAVERATTNTVMNTLSQQALSLNQPLSLAALNSSTSRLTPNLTHAVMSCQTTKDRYSRQKRRMRKNKPSETDYWRN